MKNENDSIAYEKWINGLKSKGQVKNYKPKVRDILDTYTLDEIIKNPELIDNIKTFNSLSTKETAWTALSSFLKSTGNYTDETKKKLVQSINNRKDKEQNTKKHVNSFTVISKAWKTIPENSLESLMAKLIFDIYINYPPLRSDIFMVKYRNYTDNEPRLIDNKIVFEKCIKTNMKIPDVILNEDTMKLIKLFIPQIEGDFIIPMTGIDSSRIINGKPTRLLNKLSQKYLGIKLSINDLRKTAVDKVESETKFLSPRIRIQKFTDLGRSMGHKKSTQEQYYNVNDDNIVFKKGNLNIVGEYTFAEIDGHIIIKMKK